MLAPLKARELVLLVVQVLAQLLVRLPVRPQLSQQLLRCLLLELLAPEVTQRLEALREVLQPLEVLQHREVLMLVRQQPVALTEVPQAAEVFQHLEVVMEALQQVATLAEAHQQPAVHMEAHRQPEALLVEVPQVRLHPEVPLDHQQPVGVLEILLGLLLCQLAEATQQPVAVQPLEVVRMEAHMEVLQREAHMEVRMEALQLEAHTEVLLPEVRMEALLPEARMAVLRLEALAVGLQQPEVLPPEAHLVEAHQQPEVQGLAAALLPEVAQQPVLHLELRQEPQVQTSALEAPHRKQLQKERNNQQTIAVVTNTHRASGLCFRPIHNKKTVLFVDLNWFETSC